MVLRRCGYPAATKDRTRHCSTISAKLKLFNPLSALRSLLVLFNKIADRRVFRRGLSR